MQLQTIETFVVGNPPPRHGGRYFIFVKLQTACGITGYGEIYNATFSPGLVAKMAEDVFARQFEGADPHHIERLWHKTYGAGYTMRPDVTVMGVLSSLEMACWDIIGKAAGKPVYELLGGQVHERLRSYTYLYPPAGDVYPDPAKPNVYNDPHLAAEAAVKAVEQGFTAVKFDPAGAYTIYDGHQPSLEDLERSESFCREIRAAIGTSADLLFGTHGQFTVSGAKRLARRLEAYDPLWFEEPIPPESPEDMARVANATSIPVATGERLCTKYEFSRVLAAGAASILQMNLGRVGGLLEAKKIAGMAECHSAQIAPHLYCGPLVAAANIQLATCSPNFLVLESIRTFDGFFSELLNHPIRWENGYILPSPEPGLGHDLNEEVARANPYLGTELHLGFQETPALPL
ncbi:mandelate racemase/muconate lactonizing enzyme family protein [Roseibium sp. RKSG952]|uniref:mandelate racemase/muconate lactonizing enzyme family protein n=1 Tax=Roseibium sp. RKSG952 TaxID=2529384 RepID=UPI0012BC3254|nr:mandelate racemase/muconate lactonizing enzyme family protein [Roseibium sp. RKSG952]MTH96497.1 mandelate racemase/muconate lactonizing enzyme family protein [Roseibium sp. RKSG952]